MVTDINAEFEWVNNQNLKKFRGKWIAVANKKILSSGEFADEVAYKARQKTNDMPFLIKVPLEGYLSI